MSESSRSEKLQPWLAQTLLDHPEIIRESESHEVVYSKLLDIWIIDVQSSLKGMIVELVPELKELRK